MTRNEGLWSRGSSGFRRTRRAQSLAELSIVLPFLVTLLLVIIEFGFYFYQLSAVHSASRVGAAVGIAANATEATIRSATTTALTRSLGSRVAATITVTQFNGTRSSNPSKLTIGNVLVVDVTLPYKSFTQLVNLQSFGIHKIAGTSAFVIYH